MAITAAGVGSGLDIEGIVSQLMSLERQPLVALQKKTSDTKAQISSCLLYTSDAADELT